MRAQGGTRVGSRTARRESIEVGLDKELLAPGQRVAVALSGGADSVALLCALVRGRKALGIVVSAVHVHHGLRGVEADADLAFTQQLTNGLKVPLRVVRAAVRERADAEGETLEEAGRVLRLKAFRDLLESGAADRVATAHTLDDQAETVLMKLLRGAWTEGLGGIHPVLSCGPGSVVRPLLGVTRQEVEAYLQAFAQPWREDTSNRDPAYTRNRVRHELLPLLRTFNPQISTQLARMAAVAREEEAWWGAEVHRLLPGLLLPGRPVRGGGRSAATGGDEPVVAIEVARLQALAPAMRRRVLRAAAQKSDGSINFGAVEELLALAGAGSESAGGGTRRRVSLQGGLVAERTPREIQLSRPRKASLADLPEYFVEVPGKTTAPEYDLHVLAEHLGPGDWNRQLTLRSWRPGDRVTLRHSRGPKRVSEVLDRLRVYGPERAGWPVVAEGSRVLWIRGAEVDPAILAEAGVRLEVCPDATSGNGLGQEPRFGLR